MIVLMQTVKEFSDVAGCKINMCKISHLEGHVTSVICFLQTYTLNISEKPEVRGLL